mgnify:CR=1 FL=1
MQSITSQVFELVHRGTIASLIASMLIISPLAFAESPVWSLDSGTSSAQLYQGSTANPDSVNSGVARVSGDVRLDASDLNNSVFDFSIYPADESTLMTFKSKQIVRTGNGKMKIIGDLTLTRVETNATADATEAYAGPVYDDPVIHTETRQVTFLFPNASATLLSEPVTPMHLSGSASIGHENFPGLLSAINATNWPTTVQNEQCQAPSTDADDYHGPICTATVIATTHNGNYQVTSGGEEDYVGFVSTPPAGSQTTIALDLKLVRTNTNAAAVMLSRNSATR